MDDNKKIKLNKDDLFEKVFKQYYRPLCFYAHKFIEDIDASKDIVQDVFLSMWNKELEFTNSKTLHTYLYNSVKNKCINHIQQGSTREEIKKNLSFADREESFLTKEIESEVINEIYLAIEELPIESKRIFKMSYIDNMGVQEIADALNISVNTVKTQRQRAKKFLKTRLQSHYLILLFLFINLYNRFL